MVYQNLVGSRLAIRERYRSYRFVFLFSHVLGTFFYVIGLIVGLTWAYDYMSGKMYSSLVVEELVSPIVDRVEPAFLVEMGLLLMSKVYQVRQPHSMVVCVLFGGWKNMAGIPQGEERKCRLNDYVYRVLLPVGMSAV